MKTFYIAGIVPEENGGGFSVYFPDVPNVAAGGETIEEAISNATEALADAVRDMAEKRTAMPVPSPLEAVKAKVAEERKLDGLPFPESTVFQYVPAPSADMVQVRINISVPRCSLEEIDRKAAAMGMTRSGFIVKSALAY